MIVPDRWLCRFLGHRWQPVFGVGGPWTFCRRCGETSEAPAPSGPLGTPEATK